MKIKGTRDQFLNCLSKVSPATDRANINPILSNVLLIADTGSVDISRPIKKRKLNRRAKSRRTKNLTRPCRRKISRYFTPS